MWSRKDEYCIPNPLTAERNLHTAANMLRIMWMIAHTDILPEEEECQNKKKPHLN